MDRPQALVRPLEAQWQGVLDDVLRPMRGGPPLTTKDVARLGPKVAELSRAYNQAEAEGRRTKLPLEARIAFSFPRDVPKGAAAARELVASGAVKVPADRPLRVLDLGAGLGAMTWGLVRALAASGAVGQVDAVLVDEDAEALEAARAIGRAARAVLGTAPIDLRLATEVRSLGAVSSGASAVEARAPYDVVILGQVLSEIDPRADPATRLERQAALVTDVLDRTVAPDGALVIVEPALRERTRHLHALRDRVLAGGAATVFAPCLHAATCPMLAVETEWCHEDLPVDLPPWTVPLARAAGLRWQGLTFSYLVLRKDGRTQAAGAAGDHAVRFRAVSDLLRSKGKIELFICREDGLRQRIRRLDRDAGGGRGVPFEDLRRGDVVTLSSAAETAPLGGALATPAVEASAGGDTRADDAPAPPIDERGRVSAKANVAIDVAAARK
ncbi:MAG: hypothetical protein KF795_21580 [Labilithrix sp.]|nr:hypothetical protein [Labilithrix sp.]